MFNLYINSFFFFWSALAAIGCTVSKNTDKIKINFCKINTAIKTQYLMLILTIHQKSWKIHAKTVIEKRSFYLYFLGQKIFGLNNFWWSFLHFFAIKNQHQFFRFMIPIKNFCKKKVLLLIFIIFSQLYSQTDKTAQKKM